MNSQVSTGFLSHSSCLKDDKLTMNMSETVTCYFLKWVCHHYVAGLPAIFFSEKKVLKVIFCDFKGFKGPNFCEIKGFKGPFSRF